MATKQVAGFRIRVKLVKAMIQERRKHSTNEAIRKLWKLGRSLKRSMKALCFRKSSLSYGRLEQKTAVPRGHLAVYFGEEEEDAHRVLVPVIYFNHPYFGDLLREAEKVYGFDHRGGIHVPCRISDFQSVQTRISAARGGRSWRRWL